MGKKTFLISSLMFLSFWSLSCIKDANVVPSNYGTLDALFDQKENLIIVQGTQGFNAETQVLSKWAKMLQQELRYRGRKVPIVNDNNLDVEGTKNMHLLLVGRPEANSLLKKYLPKLSIYFAGNMIQVGNKIPRTVFGEGAQVCFAIPNPENPKCFLGIFAIIYEKEIEKMWWHAAPYGEYADYIMWQPTKGPTAGGGFAQRGMFHDIFSNQEFLSLINALKIDTLKEYRNSSLIKLEEIKKASKDIRIKHVEPIIGMDKLKRKVNIKNVKINYYYSPLLDYTFLMYINSTWRGVNFERLLFPSIPLGKVGLITLPEYVAVDNLSQYSQLYSLAKTYDSSFKTGRTLTHGQRVPSYDEIVYVLKEGKSMYPRFVKKWKRYIEPIEKKMIQRWDQDFQSTRPLHYLQKLTGLQWPYDEMHICISVFHPSGSALTTDPFVFTGFFKEEELLPNVAWVIGHEGTHILLSAQEKDWKRTTKGKAVIERWGDGTEEAICLLMQNRLAWFCGFISDEEMQKFDPESQYGPTKLAYAMNQQWDLYIDNPQKYPTIIDFMIEVAEIQIP